MKPICLSLVATLVLADVATAAPKLLEPQLRLSPQAKGAVAPLRVALTFDACMGKVDARILSTLVDNRIPSTIFVTRRWLQHNPAAQAVFHAHPELFEIENHGAMHVPAVDVAMSVYGIATAGSAEAVAEEVAGGQAQIAAAGFAPAHWFRGATAKYTTSSIAEIRQMGFRIAGYSLNGDGGSLFGAALAERKIAAARDGDVIIAHINQPTHAAGEGVARGILALKARGALFVTLEGAGEDGTNGTTN